MVPRQLLRHQPIQKRSANHKRNEESRPLNRHGSRRHGNSINHPQGAPHTPVPLRDPNRCGDEVGCEGGCEKEGIGREHPDGSHSVDGEDLGRPQGQVERGGDDKAHADVNPEEDFHDAQKPGADVWDAVLADGDKDCASARGG